MGQPIPNPVKTFDSNTFFNYLRANVTDSVGLIAVVVEYCDRANVDILTAASAIKRNPEFKELITAEALQLNMIVK